MTYRRDVYGRDAAIFDALTEAGVVLPVGSGLNRQMAARAALCRRHAWPIRIRDIATALGAEAEGDLDLVIDARVRTGSGRAATIWPWRWTRNMPTGLRKGQARAALLWPGADWQALGLKAAIFAPRGRLAMAGLTRAAGPRARPSRRACIR